MEKFTKAHCRFCKEEEGTLFFSLTFHEHFHKGCCLAGKLQKNPEAISIAEEFQFSDYDMNEYLNEMINSKTTPDVMKEILKTLKSIEETQNALYDLVNFIARNM